MNNDQSGPKYDSENGDSKLEMSQKAIQRTLKEILPGAGDTLETSLANFAAQPNNLEWINYAIQTHEGKTGIKLSEEGRKNVYDLYNGWAISSNALEPGQLNPADSPDLSNSAFHTPKEDAKTKQDIPAPSKNKYLTGWKKAVNSGMLYVALAAGAIGGIGGGVLGYSLGKTSNEATISIQEENKDLKQKYNSLESRFGQFEKLLAQYKAEDKKQEKQIAEAQKAREAAENNLENLTEKYTKVEEKLASTKKELKEQDTKYKLEFTKALDTVKAKHKQELETKIKKSYQKGTKEGKETAKKEYNQNLENIKKYITGFQEGNAPKVGEPKKQPETPEAKVKEEDWNKLKQEVNQLREEIEKIYGPAKAPKSESKPKPAVPIKPLKQVKTGSTGKEAMTVTTSNPGKGPNWDTSYWSERNDPQMMAFRKKQAAKIWESRNGSLDNDVNKELFAADIAHADAMYNTPIFASHGNEAEKGAAEYSHRKAVLAILVEKGQMKKEDAEKKRLDMLRKFANRHYLGDIREGEKQVRMFRDAKDNVTLENYKGTASPSMLLTNKAVDVWKHYQANDKVKGAEQMRKIARTWDGQLWAAKAEMAYNKFNTAKQPTDKQLWDVLYNAKMASFISTDKPVDKHMKRIFDKVLETISGDADKNRLKKRSKDFILKDSMKKYSKKLPGELRHDILRGLYDFVAQVVPGVKSRASMYRHGFSMPYVTELEKKGTPLMNAKTLKAILDIGDKWDMLSYNDNRELARLYGYTLMLSADKKIRSTNGKPTLDDAIQAALNLEKAEMTFHAIDESRGHATNLAKKIRKNVSDELHDDYDVSRMWIAELAERELISEFKQGKDLLDRIKTATGHDLMNQIRKAAQWALIGASLGGGIGGNGGGSGSGSPSHGGVGGPGIIP